MRLTAAARQDVDQAHPRVRAIVACLLAEVAEMRRRNDNQARLLDDQRLAIAELERMVDAIGVARTREV